MVVVLISNVICIISVRISNGKVISDEKYKDVDVNYVMELMYF